MQDTGHWSRSNCDQSCPGQIVTKFVPTDLILVLQMDPVYWNQTKIQALRTWAYIRKIFRDSVLGLLIRNTIVFGIIDYWLIVYVLQGYMSSEYV